MTEIGAYDQGNFHPNIILLLLTNMKNNCFSTKPKRTFFLLSRSFLKGFRRNFYCGNFSSGVLQQVLQEFLCDLFVVVSATISSKIPPGVCSRTALGVSSELSFKNLMIFFHASSWNSFVPFHVKLVRISKCAANPGNFSLDTWRVPCENQTHFPIYVSKWRPCVCILPTIFFNIL